MKNIRTIALSSFAALLLAGPVIAANITWMQTQNGWKFSGKILACPSPLLKTPTSLKNVTSILYPGQTRGGFRFDTQ